MSFRALTEALTLYQSGTLSLDQAVNRAGVPPETLRAELRSRGIRVRE